MANNGALWVEQIAHQITATNANKPIARANAQVELAQSWNRGAIAQLAAALRALRELAPDHPLHHQAVLDAVDADGCRAAEFQQAWALDHSLASCCNRSQRLGQ